jgi:hypothetical protein
MGLQQVPRQAHHDERCSSDLRVERILRVVTGGWPILRKVRANSSGTRFLYAGRLSLPHGQSQRNSNCCYE